MNIPSLHQAREFLAQAADQNPGPWIQHSVLAAQAAQAIAQLHPDLDPTAAYILGSLHDIGRRVGVTDLRHMIDGYHFLHTLGFDDAAQICLTHTFPVKDIRVANGQWDCSGQERAFVQDYLDRAAYTDYDRLIQLCDALALPTGFCLIEKRLVDVALRRGVHQHTVSRWKGYFDNQRAFEQVIGKSIYSLLPGVVENTFGFDPRQVESFSGDRL
ncbi:MAG: HD domain-containing protein [Anaerolineae bacterium]|nr:HD domain-containing protein [Anaerolineae bacterium]